MSAPSRLRTTLLWLGLFGLALLLLRFGWNPEPSAPIVPDQFQGVPEVTGPVVESWAAAGELSSLVYSSEGYYWAVLIDGGAYALVGDIDPTLPTRLMNQGFPVIPLEVFRGEPQPPGILDLGVDPSFVLIIALLIGIIAFVVYYRKRQAGAGAASITALRQSKMRRLEEPSHLRFSDVGGMEDIKLRLGDMVSYLRQPQLWAGSGARPPLGILLEGPPGCGKTLLARAVAGEAGVPVFVMSGSELVEMFVGVGAARVRDTFEQARKAAPAVLFIDELDAVGRRRGSGISQLTNDEREHTLNQLLVCLDGAEKGGLSKLAVLAATNRADILDPALLRAGRFDLRLTVRLPDLASRAAILSIHCRHLQLAPQVDLGHLAEQTDGLSGAELELLCNEAAVQAARRSISEKRTSLVSPDDLALGLAQARHASENLGPLDSLLIDSASQICKPRRPLWVTIDLEGGGGASGELLWADPTWLKLRPNDGSPARILARRAIFGISQMGPVDEEVPEESPTFDLYPLSLPGSPREPSQTPNLAPADRLPPPDVFGPPEGSPERPAGEGSGPAPAPGVGPEEAPRGPHR